MPKRVCLLVNPSAGGGRARRLAPAAERALRAHGLEVSRADTRDLEHARELAASAAAEGRIVVALSGDGLLGALADRLRDRPEALLGVIPGGRGNDLARVLGIPQDADGAAAVVAAGRVRALDLGMVEEIGASDGGGAADAGAGAGGPGPARAARGRAFVGIASAGFDSDANRIANEAPAWLGGLVYLYGALRALAGWRPARFEIELDPPGERYVFDAYSIGAANSKTYGGGMRAAPDAKLDDGLLEVIVLENVSKLAFLTRVLPKVFGGSHVREPGVHVFRAREIELSADRPFTMYADGDPIGELPVRVRALPAAVRVLAPAQAGPAFSEG
ncbi:MAG TPA: diacylglycerol kinase family protein [Solirubrobacteraceae bacterium]|nr:diacylglycerol kinase family protein [Solirubrobacteraceae bacterium]